MTAVVSREIRLHGRVQGVGMRPSICRLATSLGLVGCVRNDGRGVVAYARGVPAALEDLVARIVRDPPPLARVERVEVRPCDDVDAVSFRIAPTDAIGGGRAATEIAPDAAICRPCLDEATSPSNRRLGHAFVACTSCGPRFSMARALPFDRATTSMSAFAMCEACAVEYADPADRRFHAEAIACPCCGPRLRFLRGAEASEGDPIALARAALDAGEILAIKGVGGFHLACDATRADVVARLRARKHREAKPFALMARDVDVIRAHAHVSPTEADLLASAAAPIVLLRRRGDALPEVIAPHLAELGFMLPTTPLHAMLLHRLDRPLVMTSGNPVGAPTIIDDASAAEVFSGFADATLSHDRRIEHRADDSLARVMDGAPRVLRRARGYAPSPIRLPPGFASAPPLLAVGAELKSTFCLLANGDATLSPHLGDLDDARSVDAYDASIGRFARLFDHAPDAIVCDLHEGYASTKWARRRGLPVQRVQHHHAHAAACLVENGWPLEGGPVLAIVLDGVGLGADGTIWGGELLLADYRRAVRLGSLRSIPMLGGDRASLEPWRNLYAHVTETMGWEVFESRFGSLDVARRLANAPRALLDSMRASGVFAPRASSTGRLFDAVAAALGIAFERQVYEGEAPMRLEAIAEAAEPYPFAIDRGEPLVLDPAPMWRSLFEDLLVGERPAKISGRFHAGLAQALVDGVGALRAAGHRFDAVALSGGCFQNRLLSDEVRRRTAELGLRVLEHASVPTNDGGIALGQATVGAARLLFSDSHRKRCELYVGSTEPTT